MFVFKTLTFYINNLLQMTINRVVKIIRICTIDKDWMREEIIRSQIDAMTIHHQFDKRLITCCIKSGKVTSSCFSLVDYLSTAQINGRWICVCLRYTHQNEDENKRQNPFIFSSNHCLSRWRKQKKRFTYCSIVSLV